MKRKTPYILLLIALFFTTQQAFSEEKSDSVASTALQEVVVQGENAWIEGNKAIFLPTKRQRNLATDPASLIKNMHLPMVYVENGAIKGLNGKGIPVYINGEKADDIDIGTFWPKQAKRVEYIQNPTDPKYGGAEAVINFVMQQYEIGGVTKVSADQVFPNIGRYSLASKLERKNLRVAAMFDGGYSRDHSSSSFGEEHYKDIYYNGTLYDDITRSYEQHSWTRNDRASAGVNIRYGTNDYVIRHSANFGWKRNPGSGSIYSDVWSPDLFAGNSSTSTSNGHNITPQLNGLYAFNLTSNSYIQLDWSYVYAQNNTASIFQNAGLSPIDNRTSEDVHGMLAQLYYFNSLKGKFQIGLTAKTNMDWYATHYKGSVNTLYKQHRGASSLTLNMYYTPNPKMQLTFTPGVVVDYWKSGDNKTEADIVPMATLSYYWAPSNKFNLNASLNYWNRTPQSSTTSDILMRQTDLIWIAGNPKLKNNIMFRPIIFMTYLPTSWLRMSMSLTMFKNYRQLISINRVATSELGGIIKTYANAAPEDSYGMDLFITGSFFNNNLNVTLQPVLSREVAHGEYAKSHNSFRMRGDASYSVGNCEFSIGYNGAEKYITNAGMGMGWHGDEWIFSFTYGQGDIYLTALIYDIFHSKAKSWDKTFSPCYDTFNQNFNTGRRVRIMLTYTFGYGKKLKDKSINVSGPKEVKSGAVNSEITR